MFGLARGDNIAGAPISRSTLRPTFLTLTRPDHQLFTIIQIVAHSPQSTELSLKAYLHSQSNIVMEFFNPLTFRYNGTVQSGEGLCTEIFERLAMNITHEDFKKRFLEGPIPMVPTDPEFVKACRAATVNLPTVTKSSVIESSDGVPLTWFIKKGMSSPWGRIGRVLIRLSDDAVRLLTRRYPPPQKIETNARYIANLEEQKAKASADNKLFGVYVSLLA